MTRDIEDMTDAQDEERRPAHAMSPYSRIAYAFDADETANEFLRDDGEGGFAAGVYRMAEEIRRLRADLARPSQDMAQDEKVRRLIAAAGKLNGIVEGIDGAITYGTWRGENTGYRLKDTEEWVNFYIALAATHNFGDDA